MKNKRFAVSLVYTKRVKEGTMIIMKMEIVRSSSDEEAVEIVQLMHLEEMRNAKLEMYCAKPIDDKKR